MLHSEQPSQNTAPKTPIKSVWGIALMASAMFCFAIVDTLAKLLTDSFHPLQIVWMRQLGLGVGVVVYLIVRGPGALKSAKPYWQMVRGAAAALSATLFYLWHRTYCFD